jgi:hypothetical protein
LAGGFFNLEFGNPSANSDPKAKDSLAVVRTVGCHAPEKARFTATAEGRVAGARRSIPLQLDALAQPGSYAVKGSVPKEGTWVLTVAASMDDRVIVSAIAPIANNTVDRKLAKTSYGALTAEQVSDALPK